MGKTPLQIVTVMHKLMERGQLALATRVEPHVRPALLVKMVNYVEQTSHPEVDRYPLVT